MFCLADRILALPENRLYARFGKAHLKQLYQVDARTLNKAIEILFDDHFYKQFTQHNKKIANQQIKNIVKELGKPDKLFYPAHITHLRIATCYSLSRKTLKQMIQDSEMPENIKQLWANMRPVFPIQITHLIAQIGEPDIPFTANPSTPIDAYWPI